mgnify:FL=1
MNGMYDILMNRSRENPMEQLAQQKQNQPQQIDPNKFRQIVPSLNDNILSQLVAQARSQGISDSDIRAGLDFIKQLR